MDLSIWEGRKVSEILKVNYYKFSTAVFGRKF